MSKNTLYNFILKAKTPGAIFKQDKEKRPYALISLRPPEDFPEDYFLEEHHFTVFEGNNEGFDNEFHYTANLVDKINNRPLKVHVFYNRNNQQINTTLTSNAQKIEDEHLVSYIEKIALSAMLTNIVPLKAQLEDKVIKLTHHCDLRLKEVQSLLPHAPAYLSKLIEIKPLLNELTQLIPNTHPYVGRAKFISYTLKMLQTQKKQTEKITGISSSDESDTVSAAAAATAKKVQGSSAKIVSTLKKVSKSRYESQINRFIKDADSFISESPLDFNTVKFGTAEHAVFLERVKKMKALISEANGIFLVLEDDSAISFDVIMTFNKIYNQLFTLGSELFLFCIQAPYTQQAMEMTSFYHLVKPEDLSRALQNNQIALIEFFIKHCQIPVTKWQIKINETSYKSALHYLVSDPINSNKVEILINMLTLGISILSQDLTVIRALLGTNSQLEQVMNNEPVQSLTICNKTFCRQLTMLLDSPIGKQLNETERQRILAKLNPQKYVQYPSKLVELASTGQRADEEMAHITSSAFMEVWSSEKMDKLRERTFHQAYFLAMTLELNDATTEDLDKRKQKGLEVKFVNMLQIIRLKILLPRSTPINLNDFSDVDLLSDRLTNEYGRLSKLNIESIRDSLVKSYEYLTSVLELYLRLWANQKDYEDMIKTLSSFGDTAKAQAKKMEYLQQISAIDIKIFVLVSNRIKELQEVNEINPIQDGGADVEAGTEAEVRQDSESTQVSGPLSLFSPQKEDGVKQQVVEPAEEAREPESEPEHVENFMRWSCSIL